jgi:hypothetical protein
MIETYRPSGQVGVFTFPLWLLALVPAVLLGYVYQLGLYWIPFIYLNFFMTLGVAFVCGVLMKFVVKRGPCRNVLLTGVMGVVLCLGLLAAKHGFQFYAYRAEVADYVIEENQVPPAEQADVRRAVNEQFTFAEYINVRFDEGWNIGRGGRGGMPINGWFVYLVWLIEAGILVAGSLLALGQARHPFNETLLRWADEEESVATIPLNDPLVYARMREARLIDELVSPPAPDSTSGNQFLVYKVYSVPGDEMEDAFLSVVQTTLTRDKNGKQQTKEDVLHQFVVLKKAVREQLLENIERLKSEAARAAGRAEAREATSTPDNIQIDTGDA